MFPKTLPRAAVRRVIQIERNRREEIHTQSEMTKASLKGSSNEYKYCFFFFTNIDAPTPTRNLVTVQISFEKSTTEQKAFI